MLDYSIGFDSPWYLLLLVLLPPLWLLSFRSLAVLGPLRRWVALGLRSIVLVAIIFALAEIQAVRTSDRVAVLYLLDESSSIPASRRQAVREDLNASILEHRRDGDYAGVIVFGRDAAIEVPPFDDDVQMGENVESLLDPRYTNLAAAMRLAEASFPPGVARRMVILSDGAENLGDAETSARSAAESGIGIDVFPIRYAAGSDVRVERITLPPDIRQDQPFDLRVVLDHTPPSGVQNASPIRGRLILSEQTGDEPRVISDEPVTLGPGKQVFVVRQEIREAGAYSYAARFVPDDPAADQVPQNNRATALAYVRGQPKVLLIESFEKPGRQDLLVERLRRNDIHVDLRTSDQLFTDLAELQPYDTVVLADVPREHFSERQIEILVRNTHDLGAGLIMLGGEDSFGAGGWSNTKLEQAMPVDFQIKAAKVVPNGALALIMHACELPQGNHWQKVVAQEAIRTLGPNDYCGVLHWNMKEGWLWGGMRRVGGFRQQMLALVDRMQPGDMPDFGPTMEMARRGMAQLPGAAIKHVIIISDGDPAPPRRSIIRGFIAAKITISTVAIGTHGPAGSQLMADIASDTGGKYYAVNNPKGLPRIFQREARKVARPLIYEDARGFAPRRNFPNELVTGIGDRLPPITGFVMTTVKPSPLVEVPLVSPKPGATQNCTILANWQYGAGRSVAFTSDTGLRWTTAWTGWDGYDKLFSQMVRWSMRPAGGESNFLVTTKPRDGEVRLVVTALDANEALINFLDLRGTVIGPDMQPRAVQLEQVAPGRYVGRFPAKEAGSYFLSLNPGGGQAPIRTGVNVPYSAEFRRRFTNEELLRHLASQVPRGGSAGRMIEAREGETGQQAFRRDDPFRRDLPKSTSRQAAWPWAVFVAGTMLFFDVFTRRVAIRFAWLAALMRQLGDRLRRRSTAPAASEHLDQLRRRKAEVDQHLDRRHAAARFEPRDEVPAQSAVEEAIGDSQPTTDRPHHEARPTGKPAETADDESEASYTERLLRAKKQVWDRRGPNR